MCGIIKLFLHQNYSSFCCWDAPSVPRRPILCGLTQRIKEAETAEHPPTASRKPLPHLASGEGRGGSCSGFSTRKTRLCAEPVSKMDGVLFRRQCHLPVRTTRDSIAVKAPLEMPAHIPPRETLPGRSLTMSLLKGYSKLKVLASIPA